MKHKFTIRFPAGRGKRPRGQYLAAAALVLALGAVGTASVSLPGAQPEVLAVQPEAAYIETTASEQTAGEWRPSALQPAAAETGLPQEQPQPAAEQAASEETAPAAPAAEAPTAPPVQEETPAAPDEPATLTPSTPELAAEDQEAQVRQDELEATNSPSAPPVTEEENEAVPIDGPDGEIILLTPEQVGSIGIGPEDEAALEEENCLSWLLEYFFGVKIERSGWYKTFFQKDTYYYDPDTHQKVTGIQTIDGKMYYFNADGVLQKDVTFGVDVSKYQSSVDWAQLREAGAEFAILRIGYRGYETGTMVLDPMYETHMANATAAGLKVGVYFFSQAINEAEAIEEAEACLYVLDVLGHELQYPIYFDSEYATSSHKGRADGLTRAQRTACAVAFCERIQQAGYRAGVYASTNWFNSKLDYNTVSKYSIWNAHYGVAESPLACEIWQGTCTGRPNGIAGQIDINISYIG